NAPTLQEYLGPVSWYLDATHSKLDELDLVPMGAPVRETIDANWKAVAEQLAGDGYHRMSLHRALYDLDMQPQPFGAKDLFGHNLMHPKISCDQGHSIFAKVPRKRVGFGTEAIAQDPN